MAGVVHARVHVGGRLVLVEVHQPTEADATGAAQDHGGLLGVGSKQVGVRLGALKIATSDGKVSITLPAATKEMLSAVPAYQKAK